MDKALPFGQRSAPLLFSAIAEALQWAMKLGSATTSTILSL